MFKKADSSRLRFLHGLGSGAVGSALSATTARWAQAQVRASARFTRLFPKLRPFTVPSPQLTAALLDIGRGGEIMDANDDLGAGPAVLIVDAGLNLNNQNATRPEATAGTTFMGQFMDHAMAFDTASRLNEPTNVHQLQPNTRI